MTTTYDPFVPAGASGEGGYGGRRRAEEATWVEDQHWGQQQQGVPAGHWTEDPRWSGDARPAPGRPAYAPTSGYPVSGAPLQDAPREQPARGSWVRPAVAGLVAVLIVVAAWQAYRIEGMTRDNQSLTSGLSDERNRTDQLEKQLAGVFDPEAVSSKALPSVFRVRAGDFTGTAFSVGDKASGGKANLITNYHVVAEIYSDGGRKVSLERGSTQIDATIVKVNKGKDLALLQAGQGIAPLGTSEGQVKPGQQVVVVGAPLGLDDTVTSGVISAYRPGDPDGTTIQFDAAINPGNSGGPLLNADHQVVGVATAKAKDAEGIGLAIPIKTACDTFSVC
ncbi:S1C family serine protease [Actinoplanes sp. NPDC051343]|uniref:S1C family serine protease n=1 Tax=Actinoplanes sp. NPDC051343 TaxID=3363906 RepID=UPI00378C61F6